MTLSIQEISERFAQHFPPAAPAASSPPGSTKSAAAESEAAAGTDPAPAPPPPPVAFADYAKCGYHLDVRVAPDQVVTAATLLDQLGFAIDAITGLDWLAEQQMEIVYDFFHPAAVWRVVVRTRVPRDLPELPTIAPVFPGADWHERETHDFFGIRFLGHPNLTPFLLPEDADYHPLRKDFTA